MMDRRAFIQALASAVIAWSSESLAQSKVYRVGMLEAVPASDNGANLDALGRGLRSLGYVEGRNLFIEYRSADGRAERFAELASELVQLRVDVIVSRGTPAARAAKEATSSIPVIMATMGDPQALVASFARPQGNVTGVTTFSTELTAKRLEQLKELAPKIASVALFHNIGNPAAPPEWNEIQAAAKSLGLTPELVDVRSEDDLRRALDALATRHVDAVVIGADGLTQKHRQLIVAAMASSRVVASYPSREFVEAGGLISYAVNYPDLYFRLAGVIDKIFKGTKPADIPVEQPTKFELVINATTAKRLGLTIPRPLALSADQIIQ